MTYLLIIAQPTAEQRTVRYFEISHCLALPPTVPKYGPKSREKPLRRRKGFGAGCDDSAFGRTGRLVGRGATLFGRSMAVTYVPIVRKLHQTVPGTEQCLLGDRPVIHSRDRPGRTLQFPGSPIRTTASSTRL